MAVDRKFEIGAFVVSSLIVLNQFTSLVPSMVFARSSRVIENPGLNKQCLSIKSVPPGSSQRHFMLRGWLRSFVFKVQMPDGPVKGKLSYFEYLSKDVQKRRVESKETARKSCLWEDIGNGLLKSKVLSSGPTRDLFPKCGLVYHSGASKWQSTIYLAMIDEHNMARITCGNSQPEFCSIRFHHGDWGFKISFLKVKLRFWKNFAQEGKALFEEILLPLPVCPIQIPRI